MEQCQIIILYCTTDADMCIIIIIIIKKKRTFNRMCKDGHIIIIQLSINYYTCAVQRTELLPYALIYTCIIIASFLPLLSLCFLFVVVSAFLLEE